MKNIRYKNSKQGFVLSLVLWIVAAMMILSMLFIRMSKEQTEIYAKMHHKLELDLVTQSLFEKLSYYISTGTFSETTISNSLENFPSSLRIDSHEFNVTESNISCTCSLLDHNALYNIRFLTSPRQAQKTIQNIINKQYALEAIYFDWIDKDNLTRINGAERSDYFIDGYKYTPANFISFQHRDAIALLKGLQELNPKDLKHIKQYFTVYGSSTLNILLIDKEILHSFFPSYEKKEIESLIDQREKDARAYYKFFSKQYPDGEIYGIYSSKVITIDIVCSKNSIRSKFNAIIDFKPKNSRSWSILEINK